MSFDACDSTWNNNFQPKNLYNACDSTLNTNWHPVLINMDMSSGTQWGEANIKYNQVMSDLIARQHLYDVPNMNWGSFTNYGTPSGGPDFLLKPQYTINQCQWQWNNNGGFNNWGGMNFSNPWGNFGWNGGNTNGTSSADTPEERAFQKKYNKLLNLAKTIVADSSHKLSSSTKESLDDVVKHPQGKTWEEKFTHLKEAYNKIPKATVKDILGSNTSIKLKVDGKEASSEAESIYEDLQGVGFEFADSKVDSQIQTIYSGLSNISDAQNNYDNLSVLTAEGPTNSFDILDIISSWNTQKKTDKHIMELIEDKYDALSGDNKKVSRDSMKQNLIMPVANRLITRAQELSNSVDSASKTKLKNAIDALNKAVENTGDSADSNLSGAFDELYVLCRQAAIADLRAQLKDSYGEIDSELFNDKLFADETEKDLKDEGFDAADIKKGKVTAQAPAAATDPSDPAKAAETEKTEKKSVAELVKNTDILAKQSDAAIGGKKCPVYKETTGEKREFVLVDGLLYEWEDGKKGEQVSVSDIEDAYNVNKELKKFELTEDGIKSANEIGTKMQDCLHGYTTDEDWKEFENHLDSVSETNVMYVLAGYYGEAKGLIWNSDGFFSQLDSESVDNKEKKDYAKNAIITSVEKYVNANIAKLNNDEIKKDRVKKALETLKNTASTAKDLDGAMEALLLVFNTEDKATHYNGWGTVVSTTVAGAVTGAGVGFVGGSIVPGIGNLAGWASGGIIGAAGGFISGLISA